MPIDPLAMRPCGACGTYVPADTGCEHWRPGAYMRLSGARTRQRARDKARRT